MNAIDRRKLLLGAAALAAPHPALAREEPLTVWWKDLVPTEDDESQYFATLREFNLLQLGEKISPWAIQPPAAMVTKYDDKTLRIPGFIVPLAFDGLNVTEGLLVPYVGACIHVPPPPANQIVYIRLQDAKDEASLWDPVWATGRFKMAAVETELAEVGYIMSDATLEPFEYGASE